LRQSRKTRGTRGFHQRAEGCDRGLYFMTTTSTDRASGPGWHRCSPRVASEVSCLRSKSRISIGSGSAGKQTLRTASQRPSSSGKSSVTGQVQSVKMTDNFFSLHGPARTAGSQRERSRMLERSVIGCKRATEQMRPYQGRPSFALPIAPDSRGREGVPVRIFSLSVVWLRAFQRDDAPASAE
jgi:hypothetical protein